MVSEEYTEYLRSDTWQRLRSERLKIDGYKCQRCGRPFDLQVHHLFYPLELGTEDPYRDLITLCDTCHEIIEHQKKEFKDEKRNIFVKRREYELKLIYRTIREKACFDLSAVGIGTRDYCNIQVIKEDFGPVLESCDISLGYISRVQRYFRNRRYQIILTMIAGGLTPAEIVRRTKFSYTMVSKVYQNPETAKQILANERKEMEL